MSAQDATTCPGTRGGFACSMWDTCTRYDPASPNVAPHAPTVGRSPECERYVPVPEAKAWRVTGPGVELHVTGGKPTAACHAAALRTGVPFGRLTARRARHLDGKLTPA